MQSAIEITQLTKVYRLARHGHKTAVDSLDLTVREGEIFGFLGPNGAGKTSTIKMLLGFIRPTSGSARILGKSVELPESREAVGFLPEQPYFHKFMSAREIVSTHAGLIGIPRRERKGRVNDVIRAVGLEEQASSPVSKLSKGQVQRIGIAQALIGDPQLLILDEPASGLDPLGRYHIRDLLLKQKEQGRTVFLSSHLLSEIETICDRVAVLSHGKLVAVGTPEEIKRGSTEVIVRTTVLSPHDISRLHQIGAHIVESGRETTIAVESNALYNLIDVLREGNLPLLSVTPQRESLEEAFLRLAA